jgi:DNA-binding transcriptional regulator YdaS (Cro superfamily)
MSAQPHIKKAIAIAGSQPRLAELSGLSQQHISKLLKQQRQITADVAIAIERATNGKVGRCEMRPDYWPSQDQGHVP